MDSQYDLPGKFNPQRGCASDANIPLDSIERWIQEKCASAVQAEDGGETCTRLINELRTIALDAASSLESLARSHPKSSIEVFSNFFLITVNFAPTKHCRDQLDELAEKVKLGHRYPWRIAADRRTVLIETEFQFLDSMVSYLQDPGESNQVALLAEYFGASVEDSDGYSQALDLMLRLKYPVRDHIEGWVFAVKPLLKSLSPHHIALAAIRSRCIELAQGELETKRERRWKTHRKKFGKKEDYLQLSAVEQTNCLASEKRIRAMVPTDSDLNTGIEKCLRRGFLEYLKG